MMLELYDAPHKCHGKLAITKKSLAFSDVPGGFTRCSFDGVLFVVNLLRLHDYDACLCVFFDGKIGYLNFSNIHHAIRSLEFV